MRRFHVLKIFLLVFMLAAMPAAWAADLYWDSTQQFFDAGGDPLAGGSVETYDAGTTTNRTTYQDAAETLPNTNPIVLGSDGRLPAPLYIGEGTWKYVLKDGAGVTINTQDNLPGAAPDATVTSARRECPISVKTSTYSVLPADQGQCFEGNATAGAFAFNLPSAVTFGSGKMVTFRKTDSTANAITVVTSGGQQINDNGTSVQLVSKDAIVELVSDGAGWKTNNALGIAPGSVSEAELDASITGRLIKIGEIIQWTAETCPAGYLEANGATNIAKNDYLSLYNLYSADGGQTAIYGESGVEPNILFGVPDTRGVFVRGFNNGKGTGLYDIDASTRTARGDGTSGDAVGTTQAHDLFRHTHTTTNLGIFDGSSFTDGTGGIGVLTSGSAAQTRETDQGSPTGNETRPNNIQFIHCIFADPEAAAGAIAPFNTILSGPGIPVDTTGNDGDWWINTTNWDIYFKTGGSWALQTNIVGIAAINAKFDSETGDATPDTVRFNNATSASVTFVYINETDAGGVDISAYLATIIQGSDLKITKRGQDASFWLGSVSGAPVDAGDYWRIPVTHTSSSDATVANYFTDEDSLQFAVLAKGADGAQGLPGATVAVNWTFNTGTGDTNPPSGEFKVSVADLTTCNVGAACQLYISDNEIGGTDVSGWLTTWDDAGTADNRGTVTLFNISDSTIFYVLQVRNTVVDGTGYRKVDFVYLSGSGGLAGATSMMFAARGASGAGDVSGPGSSTVNHIATWNATDGSVLADGGQPIIEIDPKGKQTVNLLAAGMVARSTNGASFYSAETTTNAVMVVGYEFSASVNQAIQIAYPMPESYDGTQAMPVQFFWTTSATAGTGDVIWRARAICISNDEAIDATWGAYASVTDTFLADGDQHSTAEVNLTPGGTCAKNAMLYVELDRNAADAGDTYTQSAVLQAIPMKMTVLAPNDN